jgi:hypothetical protein
VGTIERPNRRGKPLFRIRFNKPSRTATEANRRTSSVN